jgi:hypothetical protein
MTSYFITTLNITATPKVLKVMSALLTVMELQVNMAVSPSKKDIEKEKWRLLGCYAVWLL